MSTDTILNLRHGPELLPAGGVRFRLWAPSAERVEILLEEQAPQEMRPVGEGWYETLVPHADAGSRYRYRIDSEAFVPDPASRFQPEDVHGPSEVISPDFDWQDDAWQGRPWEEAVIYELHVGTFTPEGTFAGVESRLDHLAGLGVTAIELMPISDFEGRRNWGYDGVLPYAPDASYGRPEALKSLIRAAHRRGIMVFLDVVYNHFGPSGNYLHSYAQPFFTERHMTPWGAGINFDGRQSPSVRSFFLDNALYWLNEFRFDGLRFDAVHAILDDSQPHFLHELAQTIRAAMPPGRHVHLILENEHNAADLLEEHYSAQWNDDFHHAVHVLLTGQDSGYYGDYSEDTRHKLATALTEGFIYQGHPSPRSGKKRGQPSGHLAPIAFVNHIQNHDQIGNRAMGDRLATLVGADALRFATELLLLSPFIPMLFMGEEWAEKAPFQFFCDFDGELADAVRNGRRKEFAAFPEFSDEKQRQRIPDPNAEETFIRSKIDWEKGDKAHLSFVRKLLRLRQEEIVPLLASGWIGTQHRWHTPHVLQVEWRFQKGTLQLISNLSIEPTSVPGISGRFLSGEDGEYLPAWSNRWSIM